MYAIYVYVFFSQPHSLFTFKMKGDELFMDKNELVKKIVELEDERNYLRNLLEYANETGKDLEDVILDKISYCQEELDKLEA